MRFFWAPLAAALLTACPSSAPGPAPVVPPVFDASDAAAFADAAPVPLSPCAAACVRLTAVCGKQDADCPQTLDHIDGARVLRTPDGAPLTCAAISAATSKPAMRALGVDCP